MENGSKLMIIGFAAALFATAVLLTMLMYYGALNMEEYISDRTDGRQVMEDVR